MAISRRVGGSVLALVWLASAPALAQEGAPAANGIVRGVVVDRADGTAIGDVSVRIQDAGAPVKTDAEGRFELTGVPAGQQTLYVSVVGFILVKRTIDVRPGEALDLTIALSEGTGTYTETVTVAGERFASRSDPSPPSRRSAAATSRTSATSSPTTRCAPFRCCPASAPATISAASSWSAAARSAG